MSTQTAPIISLQVKRLIKAPIARVFAAWTTPDQVRLWLGCNLMASAKMDFRVGGEYCFNMVKPQGETTVRGVYREVTPPKRLVFTWNPDGGCAGSGAGETLVTVDFTEAQGGTEVRITHERFPSADARDRHNEGWTASLEHLEEVLADVKVR
jgi:uncharacterized protein YndB with AHSA1/START domain